MQRRTKFIILFAYYLGAVILGFIIAFTTTPICLHQVCVEKSAMIYKNLDATGDPCKDFYAYACGRAQRVLKENETFYDSLYAMMIKKVIDYASNTGKGTFPPDMELKFHENLLTKFFGLCESVEKTSDSATVSDVSNKYQQSMDSMGLSFRDLFVPRTYNQTLSGGVFEVKLRKAGFPGRAFFDSIIKRDLINKTSLALYVGPPHTFQIIQVGDLKTKPRESWANIFKDLAQFYVPATRDVFKVEAKTDKTIDETAKKVIDLWYDMADVMSKVKFGRKVTDDPVRMDELQKRLPNLDFDGFLKECHAPPEARKHVFFDSGMKEYLDELQNVLHNYTRQEVVLYMFFQSMWDVTPFLDLPMQLSASLNFANLKSPAEQCKYMLGNKFGGMILSLTIERFGLSRNDPGAMRDTFVHFTLVMESLINKAPWMDSETKTSAKEKLNKMSTMVSLSDKQFDSVRTPGKRAKYYNGLCIQRSTLSTLMCMNNFFSRKNYGLYTREVLGFDEADVIPMGEIKYNQDDNSFLVPIFLLRFPSFDSSWPDHMNYGGLGIEVASRLIDGFNFDGSKHDKLGVAHDWWTNKTKDNYKQLELECEKITSKLEKKAAPNVTSPKIFTDVDLAKGELRRLYWQYISGVRIALRSYRDHKKQMTYREPKLPGLEKYSFEQAFFLSHAHAHCLPPTRPGEHHQMKRDTLLYFKALSSLKEFNAAFRCSKTSAQKSALVSKAVSKCTLF